MAFSSSSSLANTFPAVHMLAAASCSAPPMAFTWVNTAAANRASRFSRRAPDRPSTSGYIAAWPSVIRYTALGWEKSPWAASAKAARTSSLLENRERYVGLPAISSIRATTSRPRWYRDLSGLPAWQPPSSRAAASRAAPIVRFMSKPPVL